MKRILIIVSIGIAITIGVMIFLSFYQPNAPVAELVTPSPVPEAPEPTPSPTPEIQILENSQNNKLVFLDFHSLLNVMTTSQYNYVMSSSSDFFNSLLQTSVRNYTFDQYKFQYDNMLSMRFSFDSNENLMIPFDKFKAIYSSDAEEFVFILDTESLSATDSQYTFAASLYINNEIAETFDFTVNKNTLNLKIN